MQRLAEQRVAQKAEVIRNRIVENLSTPGKGRVYTWKEKGRKISHTASAPGDGPAVDLGTLRQSISVQEISPGYRRVGTSILYAPYLEYGTRHIKPRPFMRPALEATVAAGNR